MSSNTRSGGVRVAICRAISPLRARLSLWSAFRPSTRMSRFALASSTNNTRHSERFFIRSKDSQVEPLNFHKTPHPCPLPFGRGEGESSTVGLGKEVHREAPAFLEGDHWDKNQYSVPS